MRQKTRLPGSTIALRQIWVAGALCIPVGFLTVSAILFWLWRKYDDGHSWWGLVDWIIHSLELGVIGGLGLAAIVMSVLNRIHFRLGYHRCIYCGRALKGIDKPCSCLKIAELLRANASEASKKVA